MLTSLCQNLPSYKGKKLNEQHVVQQMTTVFKLTDLPNALRVHGKKHTGRVWEKAAKMQEKWFNSPAKIMPEKIKKALDTNWPADLVLTDYYTLDWLEKVNITGVVTKGIERLLKGRHRLRKMGIEKGWNRQVPNCI